MQRDHGGGKVPAGIVFTDLDGTLLDHHSYSFAAAAPALAALRRRHVPLVLCSSKTRAEMLPLQRELAVGGVLISENGGGIFAADALPWSEVLPERVDRLPAATFGAPYAELRRALAALRRELGGELTGFGDVDIHRIHEWTGLESAQAQLARQREFDEPFLWQPEPTPPQVERARELLTQRGLQLTRGGRFWHLLGQCDKGRAVTWLLQRLAAYWGGPVPSLALGDSENDLPMLLAVDCGVLVERAGGGHLTPRPAGLRCVAGEGPVGWNRAVLDWFEDEVEPMEETIHG